MRKKNKLKKNKNVKESDKNENLNKEIDRIMNENFKEYKSKKELESFIEKRYNTIIEQPLNRIHKKEKDLNKKLREKEKENEKLANEKVKTSTKHLQKNLKKYIKLSKS